MEEEEKGEGKSERGGGRDRGRGEWSAEEGVGKM